MRLSSPLLSLLINFLLGASWALALFSASIFFFFFLKINIIYATIGGILGALPFLVMILFLEYFIMRQEKLEELKKQTKLLQEILELQKKS
jgi:hypothetical protein